MEAFEAYKDFITECKKAFIDRDKEVDCLATGLISEMSAVLVGPPGTAKSGLVYAFAKGINQSYFRYLITRYTTPDELFGHFSLKALKERDSYERMTKGKMPEAQIVFLDEVFKASSALLNSLLTIMNEKEVDVGNGIRKKCPLELFIGASNEYPFDDESLGALWDRWMFRLHVDDINPMRSNNFERLIMDPDLGVVTATMDFAHIQKLRADRDSVDCRPILPILADLLTFLKMQKIDVSSRRWRNCVKIIQSRAAMAGRSEAVPSDVRILSEVLWNRPEQRESIAGKLAELCAGALLDAMKLHDAAMELCERIDNSPHLEGTELMQALIDVNNGLKALVKTEVPKFKDETDPEVIELVEAVHGYNKKFKHALLAHCNGD